MLIRTALPEDAQVLADLGRRLWRETYAGLIPDKNLELHLAETFDQGLQDAELSDSSCTTLVIEEDGSLLGYALLRACGSEMESDQLQFTRPLEVARFYVDKSLHGKGAAQQLMAAVLAHAAAAGHGGIWLQVWEQNPKAIRFYAKAGFTDIGATTFPVGDETYQDRLLVHTLMARKL